MLKCLHYFLQFILFIFCFTAADAQAGKPDFRKKLDQYYLSATKVNRSFSNMLVVETERRGQQD